MYIVMYSENLLVTRQYLRSTSNDGEGQGIRIRDKHVGDQIIHNHVTNRCREGGGENGVQGVATAVAHPP